MRLSVLTAALLAALSLAGCESPAPRTDANFGKAVRGMIRAQTYDPQAAAHPPALAPAIGDAVRLENVIKAHRKDVPAGSEQVAKPAQFESTSH